MISMGERAEDGVTENTRLTQGETKVRNLLPVSLKVLRMNLQVVLPTSTRLSK